MQADPVVRYEWAKKTQKYLTDAGFNNYVLKDYRGMQHSLCEEEIEDALAFLKKCLPEDTALAIKGKEPEEMSIKEVGYALRLGRYLYL